jgi:hypothetical protein
VLRHGADASPLIRTLPVVRWCSARQARHDSIERLSSTWTGDEADVRGVDFAVRAMTAHVEWSRARIPIQDSSTRLSVLR